MQKSAKWRGFRDLVALLL